MMHINSIMSLDSTSFVSTPGESEATDTRCPESTIASRHNKKGSKLFDSAFSSVRRIQETSQRSDKEGQASKKKLRPKLLQKDIRICRRMSEERTRQRRRTSVLLLQFPNLREHLGNSQGKEQRTQVLSYNMCPKIKYSRIKPHKITSTKHIAVLTRSSCSLVIGYARRALENNSYNGNVTSMVYQKRVAALDKTREMIYGIPCWYCDKIIPVGIMYLRKRSGKGGSKPYHIACAKRVNIL